MPAKTVSPRTQPADSSGRLQSAIDTAIKAGDALYLNPGETGEWRISDTIRIDAKNEFDIQFSPRAFLKLSNPAKGGLLIKSSDPNTYTRKLLHLPRVVGSLTKEPDDESLTQFGIRCEHAHGLTLFVPHCELCAGPGLEIIHSYGMNIFGGWMHRNNVNWRCDGANGVGAFGLTLRYGFVGAIDPQAMFAGMVEGNRADGVQVNSRTHRMNLWSTYFEQNASTMPGAADIRNVNDKAVSAGIGGCFFASSYGDNERKFSAHNLKGIFNELVTSGNMRWFHATGPHKQFDIAGSVVRDGAGTNDMASAPNGFDKTPGKVTYTRT